MTLFDFENLNFEDWSEECQDKPIQIKLGNKFYDIEHIEEDDKGAIIVLKDFSCLR